MLALIGFVGLGLLVGAAAGGVTAPAVRHWYPSLTRPPGTPPEWVFTPVWMLLYVAIAVAAWLVWKRVGASRSLRLWGWQLLANALWPPAFFGLHSPVAGLIVLAVLLPLVLLTMLAFLRVHRGAAALLAPYTAWCCFATYLNVGFLVLNSG